MLTLFLKGWFGMVGYYIIRPVHMRLRMGTDVLVA